MKEAIRLDIKVMEKEDIVGSSGEHEYYKSDVIINPTVGVRSKLR